MGPSLPSPFFVMVKAAGLSLAFVDDTWFPTTSTEWFPLFFSSSYRPARGTVTLPSLLAREQAGSVRSNVARTTIPPLWPGHTLATFFLFFFVSGASTQAIAAAIWQILGPVLLFPSRPTGREQGCFFFHHSRDRRLADRT